MDVRIDIVVRGGLPRIVSRLQGSGMRVLQAVDMQVPEQQLLVLAIRSAGHWRTCSSSLSSHR
jgi:hypothetical protein